MTTKRSSSWTLPDKLIAIGLGAVAVAAAAVTVAILAAIISLAVILVREAAASECVTRSEVVAEVLIKYPDAHPSVTPKHAVSGLTAIYNKQPPPTSVVADAVIVFKNGNWPTLLMVMFSNGCRVASTVIPVSVYKHMTGHDPRVQRVAA